MDLIKDNTKFVDKNKLEHLIDQIMKKSTIPLKASNIKEQFKDLYDIRTPIHKVYCILKLSLHDSY